MYKVNSDKNKITQIREMSFSQLGIRERDHLQEWIADYPICLGEDLLIIQKEFNGFDETNERLDLLALDKIGNLVIIENKLDDSGKNVTWQCLKYASYCSSLKKQQIVSIFQEYLNKNTIESNAENIICDFLMVEDIKEATINIGATQRMILVAGKFRKEVTSTVLWLSNFGLKIQCFKAIPYSHNDEILLKIDQIIPVKQAEDYIIKIIEKDQENADSQELLKSRHVIRLKFWKQVLIKIKEKSELYSNISPSKYNWISTGSGMYGVKFNLVAGKDYHRAEIYIDRKDKEENEYVFNLLKERSVELTNDLKTSLKWEKLENKRACRIKYENEEFNLFGDESYWDEAIDELTNNVIDLHRQFIPIIDDINSKIKSN